MINLKVNFSIDPTGMELKDITEEIVIPSDVCLFCLHDANHNIRRLQQEVKKALEYKGYDLSRYFDLMKVHTL